MHLAMITTYFIEHMFGFSKKQKAGSSQMVPALLSLILIFIIQYYDVRGKSPDFDAYGLFRATHSHVSAPLRSVLDMCHWHIAPYPIFAYRGIIIPLLCSYRGGS